MSQIVVEIDNIGVPTPPTVTTTGLTVHCYSCNRLSPSTFEVIVDKRAGT